MPKLIGVNIPGYRTLYDLHFWSIAVMLANNLNFEIRAPSLLTLVLNRIYYFISFFFAAVLWFGGGGWGGGGSLC